MGTNQASKKVTQFEVSKAGKKIQQKIRLRPSTKSVLAALCDHYPYIHIRQRTIAREAAISLRSAHNSIRELRELNLIVTTGELGECLTYQFTGLFFELAELTYPCAKNTGKGAQKVAYHETNKHITNKKHTSCEPEKTIDSNIKNNDVISENSLNNEVVTVQEEVLQASETVDTSSIQNIVSVQDVKNSRNDEYTPEQKKEYAKLVTKLKSLNVTDWQMMIKRHGVEKINHALAFVLRKPKVRSIGGYLRTTLINGLDLIENTGSKQESIAEKIERLMNNNNSCLTSEIIAKHQLEGYIQDLMYNRVTDRNKSIRLILAIQYVWQFKKEEIWYLHEFEKIINKDNSIISMVQDFKSEITTILGSYQDKINEVRNQEKVSAIPDISKTSEKEDEIPFKTREEAIKFLIPLTKFSNGLKCQLSRKAMEKWSITISDLQGEREVQDGK